jgi:CSLREA domain-containing protein
VWFRVAIAKTVLPLVLLLVAGTLLGGRAQADGQIVNVQASGGTIAPGSSLTIDFSYSGQGSPSFGAINVDGTVVNSVEGPRDVGGLTVLVESRGAGAFHATIAVPPSFPLGSMIEVYLSIFTGTSKDDAHTPLSTLYQVAVGSLVVTSNDDADDGLCDASHCSLREAIHAANTNGAAPNTIDFATDALFSGPNRILLETPLPPIVNDLVLMADGRVELSGEMLPLSDGIGEMTLADAQQFAGLVVIDAALTLHGLTVHSLPGDGIILDSGGPHHLSDNWFGTTVTGVVDLSNGEADVRINARDHLVDLEVEMQGNTHSGRIDVDGDGRAVFNLPTLGPGTAPEVRVMVNANADGMYTIGSDGFDTALGLDVEANIDVGDEVDLTLKGTWRDGGVRISVAGEGDFTFRTKRLELHNVLGTGIDITMEGEVDARVILEETAFFSSLADNLGIFYNASGSLTVDLTDLVSEDAGGDGARLEFGLVAEQTGEIRIDRSRFAGNGGAGASIRAEVIDEGVTATVTASNSQFEGGQSGIEIDITSAVIAIGTQVVQFLNDGNHFQGQSGSAIRLSGGSATINGDVFVDTGNAIDLRDGATATITANSIDDSAADAIRIRDSSSADVRGNTIRGSGRWAIAAEATSELSETGNIFAANASGDVDRDAPPRRTVELRPEWNLVGWTGAATPVSNAVEGLGSGLGAVFTWDVAAGVFQSYALALPAFLNTLSDLLPGAGIWLRVAGGAGVTWEQPPVTAAQSVPLLAGFNLVVWMGPDGTPVAEATASLGDGLVSLFTYDSLSQRFLSFLPGLPDALNSATTLRHGDGVWIDVSEATIWDQPAP